MTPPTLRRAPKNPTLRNDSFVIGLIVCGLVLSIGLVPRTLPAADRWYVEFAGGDFDEAQVRRAVALELREVEIPGNPQRAGDGLVDVSLRVLVIDQGHALEVSLWDRGEFAGRRRVSGSSQSRILARRVGLAVGELGRQLADQRMRSLVRLEKERMEAEAKAAEMARQERLRRPTLRAGASSLWIPQGAWLMGPRLGIEFNDQIPLRFSPSVAWMAGPLTALSDASLGGTAPDFSVFDLALEAQYTLDVGKDSALELGGLAALSVLHVGGPSSVDGILGQRDTWTARAGGKLGWTRALSPSVRLQLGLTGGALLRRVPIIHGQTDMRLGGGFVGLDVGVALGGLSH